MKRSFLSIIALLFLLHIHAQNAYTSIEQLAKESKIELELKSLGGYQGSCVEINIKNLTSEKLQLWLEAGRRLDNTDPTQQDILVLKEQKFELKAHAESTINAYGFCCMAHNGSPSIGKKYTIGWMETGNLLWIAQYINETNGLDQSIIQSAVWIFSNGNNPASMLLSKEEKVQDLKKAVASKLNIEIPWYEIYYKKDTNSVFSDKHYTLKGTIEYGLHNRGWISMVVRGPQKQIFHKFTETAFVEGGHYSYDVDLNIRNWPKGKYEIEIVLDDIMKKKIEFTI